jgi:osmotically-inducible protein OsmY
MPIQLRNRPVFRLFAEVTFAALSCCATAVGANLVGAGGFPLLKEIVVEGTKHPESAADAELNKQVETAMRSDRYFYDDHVTATTRNGVVVLRGMVFDEWDVRTAIRISKRIAGVKRVINQLEIGAQP